MSQITPLEGVVPAAFFKNCDAKFAQNTMKIFPNAYISAPLLKIG
jgi:hypothetical protein